MITIIHGDDTSASRSYLSLLRGSVTDPIILSGESIDITFLTQILTSGGLFEDPKFVSIEQLLSSNKSTDTIEIVKTLINNSETHNIVIWENKELTKVSLSKFPKATVKQFKLPQTLFQLMDSLKPGNSRQIISLYHTTRGQTADELIFFMLARQMRILLAVKTGAEISELKSVSWQMSKLRQQAGYFMIDELKVIHEEMYEIERQTKTGDGVLEVSALIDFLLLKI